MYKDVFGREFQEGNVVLISRGGRGHKDFEKGIVTKVDDSGKKTWLKFSEGYYYRAWNNKTSRRDGLETFYLRSQEKVLIEDGVNKHITVVLNASALKDRELDEVARKLLVSGILPQGYILGEPTNQFTAPQPVSMEISVPEGSPLKESDLLSSLGAPKSLSKRGSNV